MGIGSIYRGSGRRWRVGRGTEELKQVHKGHLWSLPDCGLCLSDVISSYELPGSLVITLILIQRLLF